MPSWTFYAALSAVFAGLVPVLGKRGLTGVDSTLATTVRSAVMTAFLLMAAGLGGKLAGAVRLDRPALTAIALSGVAGALSWLFYFLALRDGPVAAVAGIDRTSVIFAVVLAALFLAEPITPRTIAGSVLVAAGALLMALK
ncbi:MAG: EamA family transporter [Bryobacterales bacterium]